MRVFSAILLFEKGGIIMMTIKKIGERIKLLRKDLKLTQEEFGAKIGVKGNTVTGYERGSRTPSDSVINYICLIFNVNQTWLRTGDGDMYLDGFDGGSLSSLWSEYDCNNIEIEFLKSYFSLKKSDRSAFCKILHKMFPQSIPEPQDVSPLDDTDFQETLPIESEPTAAEILAELEAVKQQNRELTARLEAIEKEDEIAEEPLSKVRKKSSF